MEGQPKGVLLPRTASGVGLGLENSKAAYVAEMEAIHADLEKRNRYLMDELERPSREQEKPGLTLRAKCSHCPQNCPY